MFRGTNIHLKTLQLICKFFYRRFAHREGFFNVFYKNKIDSHTLIHMDMVCLVEYTEETLNNEQMACKIIIKITSKV